MQTIIHPLKSIHPVFDDFDRMYAQLSEKEEKKPLIVSQYDRSFQPLYELFESYGHSGFIEFIEKKYPPLEIPRKDKTVIVCFSGGKDSIAVVKYYLDMGYNVYLYHLRHINQALTDEYLIAEEVARYLDIPIFVDILKLSGYHSYVEHPMKNMIIANGAIQYGIREGIGTNIAFGSYKTSSLQDDNFEFCGGDDKEMWEIYNNIMQKFIPDFKMQVVLSHLGETLETVCSDRELLDRSVSCLGRSNLRSYWHNWVLSKYGVDLPKHRCGRCYKCCVEYIYMADNGFQEYNEDYYRYCFGNLKKNVEREDGTRYSDYDVWNHYFFYSISQSKYFGDN